MHLNRTNHAEGAMRRAVIPVEIGKHRVGRQEGAIESDTEGVRRRGQRGLKYTIVGNDIMGAAANPNPSHGIANIDVEIRGFKNEAERCDFDDVVVLRSGSGREEQSGRENCARTNERRCFHGYRGSPGKSPILCDILGHGYEKNWHQKAPASLSEVPGLKSQLAFRGGRS